MKIGDIIRRKASDGAPIGPYMRVEVIKDGYVYASTFGLDEPNILLQKKSCKVIKTFCVLVSEQILEKCSKQQQFLISHPQSKHWTSLWLKKDKYDVVILRTIPKDNRHAFVLDNVYRECHFKETQIRVALGEKIYQL